MALTTCPDCGKEVSTAAPTCPGCGHPFKVQEMTEKVGLLGKRGTAFGSLNFGCLAVLLGVLALCVVMLIARWIAG